MNTRKPPPPEAAHELPPRPVPAPRERGSNEVEHEPDPAADHSPDGEQRYIRRSPYTSGND